MPSSASSDRRRPIPWIRDDLIDYGDVELELCTPPALYVQETVGQHFIVGKDRDMVEDELAEVGTRRVERMVDVGVYKGGSVVLYHKVFAPEKLVAIELSTTPLPSLDAYAARQSDRSVVIARGVNQADAAALDRICVDEFAGQPLDLVVDDASHLYAETRATFQALFPRLRTGALYIIEDWSWAHWPGDFWQKERGGPYFRDKEPLTNLLIELALLCGSSPEIVSRVHIRPMVAFVERGPASVAPNFEPSQHYFSRGAPAPRFDPRRSADQLIFASSTFSFRQ